MWHFDIYHNIYSADMNRRIAICERRGDESDRFQKRCKTYVYTLYEEWHTPNSQGNTGDFDYYTFMTYQDAAVFVAELAIKFNSHAQRALMRAAEVFATRITGDFKYDKKKFEIELKERKTAANLKQEEKSLKRVYVFALSNGTVKIGVSSSVEKRRQTIQNNSGLNIPRWCYTKFLKKKHAIEIESACHSFFIENRTRGEFFNVPYDVARAKLNEYESVFNEEEEVKQ